MTTTNDIISIRGTEYRVRHVSEDLGHLGARFFGRRRYSLVRRADGIYFTWTGKHLSSNCRVRLDKAFYADGQARAGAHDGQCNKILTAQADGSLACPCMVRGFDPMAGVQRPGDLLPGAHLDGCSMAAHRTPTGALRCPCRGIGVLPA